MRHILHYKCCMSKMHLNAFELRVTYLNVTLQDATGNVKCLNCAFIICLICEKIVLSSHKIVITKILFERSNHLVLQTNAFKDVSASLLTRGNFETHQFWKIEFQVVLYEALFSLLKMKNIAFYYCNVLDFLQSKRSIFS